MLEKRYLRSIRLLAECMQLFEKSSSQRVRAIGFTDSQFDVIATLGNTAGMTCKELGEKTLITKGTLTGVIDRLKEKGLVNRERSNTDRRQSHIKLTDAGNDIFQQVFPQIVRQGRRNFSDYSEHDFLLLEEQLLKLKNSLSKE